MKYFVITEDTNIDEAFYDRVSALGVNTCSNFTSKIVTDFTNDHIFKDFNLSMQPSNKEAVNEVLEAWAVKQYDVWHDDNVVMPRHAFEEIISKVIQTQADRAKKEKEELVREIFKIIKRELQSTDSGEVQSYLERAESRIKAIATAQGININD